MKRLFKRSGWLFPCLFPAVLAGVGMVLTACSAKTYPTVANGPGGGGLSTVLGAGDVAFVAVASRGANFNDQFAAVILKPINAGTTLIFTAANSTQNGAGFQSTESNLTWVAGRDFPAGSVFELFDGDPMPVTVFANGTAYDQTANVDSNDGDFGMSKNGDNLFAIQGSLSNPTFLAGIVLGGNGNSLTWGGTDDNGRVEYLPPSLTKGTNANSLDTYSYGYYDCSKTTAGTVAQLDAAINNPANWTGLQDDSNLDLNPFDDVLSCTIVPE
ncbi:MAG TPA: hypothetical protein VMU88_07220 [bacterium]|nr:hypothetical protein [bacterium]